MTFITLYFERFHIVYPFCPQIMDVASGSEFEKWFGWIHSQRMKTKRYCSVWCIFQIKRVLPTVGNPSTPYLNQEVGSGQPFPWVFMQIRTCFTMWLFLFPLFPPKKMQTVATMWSPQTKSLSWGSHNSNFTMVYDTSTYSELGS